MLHKTIADVLGWISKLLDYKFDKEPWEATEKFKADMNEINEKLKERNEKMKSKMEIPYTYLMPSKIPNSITI